MKTGPYTNFTLDLDDRGVLTATLNVPDRPMNVFSQEMLQELRAIVDDLAQAKEVKVTVFRSGKESGFLAGADIKGFTDVKSSAEANDLIANGQNLFSDVEKLPCKTIAAIHGPCLGGGLELSLACNHRVAQDSDATKIGLPEIMLGIIPGWGGTQRLPKQVGLATGLKMILTGKQLDATKAYEFGLVDRVIPAANWDAGIAEFVNDVLNDRNLDSPTKRRPLTQRLVDATGIGRSFIFNMTEKQIRSNVKQYPALGGALKAVRAGYPGGQAGFDTEREEFVKLIQTPTCHSLLGLFFGREKARTLATWSPDHTDALDQMPINTVGIVGAGAMGAGIGQLSATRGYDVVIKEIDKTAADDAQRRITKAIDRLAARKNWDEARHMALLEKIEVTDDDMPLKSCDLVVEAVVEKDDVKDIVFGSLDRVVQESAILASNTSSLSVTRMATSTNRANQVAGLHFFNPVHRMELVEVVRAEKTDDLTIARLVGFVKAVGKTPIVTTDSPGFLVNRVLFPYLGEAVLMVTEGFEIEQIDKEIRRFGMPMGPLELLDQVGLDVAHHVASSLMEKMPEVRTVVDQFAGLLESGYLGKKSGRGFYRYPKGKKTGATILPGMDADLVPPDLGDNYYNDSMTAIQRRLIYPMLSESIKCHVEGVVKEPWAIDVAMVLGTGFSPPRGGPLHVVDSIGADTVLSNLKRLQEKHGDRFEPPQRLAEMAEHNETFFDSLEVPA
ncbi:MAG: multifunctional fatty acid oxidation complex subunit alpha [Pirellulaceae bacterium]|nr:multifunctional fatty acid oxidation complex subunit alpha [Pirellulaceae bacterium]